MEVIIHVIDMENQDSGVRLIVKSIKKKTQPGMWMKHKYLYFCTLKEFQIEKTRLFDYQITELYEATHDISDCDACEEREDSYCETRRMIVEDYD